MNTMFMSNNPMLMSRAGTFNPQLAAELANSNVARIVNSGGGQALRDVPSNMVKYIGRNQSKPVSGASPRDVWNNGGAVPAAAIQQGIPAIQFDPRSVLQTRPLDI